MKISVANDLVGCGWTEWKTLNRRMIKLLNETAASNAEINDNLMNRFFSYINNIFP